MMDAENHSIDLGPWKDADLVGTARENAGTGADEDLPKEVRFIGGVAKLIRRRLTQQGATVDPTRPAVFLLEPAPRPHKPDITPKRVPMLNNGLTAVTGRLWFVSPVVVAGHYVDLDDCNDDELFRIVTDELKLGSVPAVVFDPRTTIPEVRFYRDGLSYPEMVEVVTVTHTDISLAQILDVIDRVYNNLLVTPEAQAKAGKLWEDSAKCWPSKQAEDIVQLYLRVGLTTAFPTCTVRPEQTSVPGRLDLEIEERDLLDSSRFTRHAVLELKVLRSYWSTGTTVSDRETLEWVESGVKQAATYRDDKGALASALCCFDMRRQRTGEECFNHVRELATTLNVALKLWYIYATSALFRDAATGTG